MRISTGQIWNSALSNLMQAQTSRDTANNQLSSQKVADSLGGYGRTSEVITTYQSSLERINGYSSVATTVSDRLESQNVALERAGEGIASGKDTILNAIASGSLEGLASSLQSSYMAFVDGVNYKHQGSYLFGGGNENQTPLAAGTLSDLTTLDTTDTFKNGSVKKSSQIDATTVLQTGMLASDIGTETTDVFRDVQAFIEANAPMTGKMTDEQQAQLQELANRMSTAYTNLVDKTSLNGSMQNRVDNTLTSLTTQANSLSGLIADKTDVDMAEAYTRFEQADVAVQAASQVVANLRSTSLLDLLS